MQETDTIDKMVDEFKATQNDLTQVPSYNELLENKKILEEKGITPEPPDNKFYRELHIRAENVNSPEALNQSQLSIGSNPVQLRPPKPLYLNPNT